MVDKKSKKKEKEPIKITHIMRDGTERKSVEGYVIPYNEQTKIVYMMLTGISVK